MATRAIMEAKAEGPKLPETVRRRLWTANSGTGLRVAADFSRSAIFPYKVGGIGTTHSVMLADVMLQMGIIKATRTEKAHRKDKDHGVPQELLATRQVLDHYERVFKTPEPKEGDNEDAAWLSPELRLQRAGLVSGSLAISLSLAEEITADYFDSGIHGPTFRSLKQYAGEVLYQNRMVELDTLPASQNLRQAI